MEKQKIIECLNEEIRECDKKEWTARELEEDWGYDECRLYRRIRKEMLEQFLCMMLKGS